MSEPIPAHIIIGGKPILNEVAILYNTTEDFFEEFISAIAEEGAGWSWGDYLDNKDDLIKSLRDLKKGENIHLYADQANYGELEELEAFCKKYSLTYVKYAQGEMEYNADIHQWKPGIPIEDEIIYTTQDEAPVILASTIQKVLDSAKDDTDAVRAVKSLLQHNTPIDVPPLDLSEVWKVYESNENIKK